MRIKLSHIIIGVAGILLLTGFVKRKEIMKFAKVEAVFLRYGDPKGRGYITHLYNTWQEKKDLVNRVWTKDKIIAKIKEVAAKRGVPFGLLFANIKHESGLRPVGNTAGSLDSLLQHGYTAYGMGQVTLPTFISEVQPFDPQYMHEDLWNPEFGIDASALVLKSKIKSAGGDIQKAMENYRGVKTLYEKGRIEEAEQAKRDVEKRLELAQKIEKGLVKV